MGEREPVRKYRAIHAEAMTHELIVYTEWHVYLLSDGGLAERCKYKLFQARGSFELRGIAIYERYTEYRMPTYGVKYG